VITQAQIDAVAKRLQGMPLDESVLGSLRGAFSGIHFSYCRDEDVIAATPVHTAASFNLYLIDSGSHCLALTHEMSAAGGILVAETEAEDGV